MTITTEPPSSVIAGNTFSLTVQVKDSLGNAISGGSVTVALGTNPSDGTLSGTLTEPVADGQAVFSNLMLSARRRRLHLDRDRWQRLPDNKPHHRCGHWQRDPDCGDHLT